jgi:hypothetical protein
VVNGGGEIGIFDDDIGLGKAGLDIALFRIPFDQHLALDVLECIDPRQGLIFDFDEPGRPLGEVMRLGGENRHGVSAETDRILGQDWELGIAARVRSGNIFRRQNAVHAGQGEQIGRAHV